MRYGILQTSIKDGTDACGQSITPVQLGWLLLLYVLITLIMFGNTIAIHTKELELRGPEKKFSILSTRPSAMSTLQREGREPSLTSRMTGMTSGFGESF